MKKFTYLSLLLSSFTYCFSFFHFKKIIIFNFKNKFLARIDLLLAISLKLLKFRSNRVIRLYSIVHEIYQIATGYSIKRFRTEVPFL